MSFNDYDFLDIKYGKNIVDKLLKEAYIEKNCKYCKRQKLCENYKEIIKRNLLPNNALKDYIQLAKYSDFFFNMNCFLQFGKNLYF